MEMSPHVLMEEFDQFSRENNSPFEKFDVRWQTESGDYNSESNTLQKKRFEINFFVRQNASKFSIFIEIENPHR